MLTMGFYTPVSPSLFEEFILETGDSAKKKIFKRKEIESFSDKKSGVHSLSLECETGPAFFRVLGRGLFRTGAVRFSHSKPREPRKPRDEHLQTTHLFNTIIPVFRGTTR